MHVKKIYFAGGEPLLMDEHWKILEMLVENRRFDVKINYNTNCSTLMYGKKSVLDYWKLWQYPKLEVWPSIDEVGDRAEIIRSGTVWSKIEENLKEISKYDNIIIRPGITVGAMNVFRLPEIIDFFAQSGILKERFKYKNFFINLLETPQHYHVQILPDNFKQDIIKKIDRFIERHNREYRTDVEHLFTHIKHELTKPHFPKSATKFLEITKQLDSVRNESTFDTIPELQILNDMYPGIYKR